MSENRLKPRAAESDNEIMKETNLSDNFSSGVDTGSGGYLMAAGSNDGSSFGCRGGAASQPLLSDAKLEKKVTFARLLNKVSAEMSSGSETTHTESAVSLPIVIGHHCGSIPASPSGGGAGPHDMRSPFSTSSNQGSDSLSSSDLMLPDIESRYATAAAINNNNRRLHPKVSSADSILTMFRNFASTNVRVASPSSSAGAQSPLDDNMVDDESSTSSLHTPVSYTSASAGPGATSGSSDPSLAYYRQQNTIQVPVLDLLSSQSSSSAAADQSNQSSSSSSSYLNAPTILLELPTNINKCLSPIREMPTPMPSPALTPVVSRPQRYKRFANTSRNYMSTSFSDDDENISIEQYDVSIL